MVSQLPPGVLDVDAQIQRLSEIVAESDRKRRESEKMRCATIAIPWQVCAAFTVAVAMLLAAGGGLVTAGIVLATYLR